MLRTFLHSASGRADLLAAKWRPSPFTGFVFALVSFCISCNAFTQAPTRVEWRQGLLTVDAEAVPLSEVLHEVSTQTGIEFSGLDNLQKQISVHFFNVPLGAGLQMLLVPVDYRIFGDPCCPRTMRVVVFERRALPTRIHSVGEPTKLGDKGLAGADASGAQGNEEVPQKEDENFPTDNSTGVGEHDDQTTVEQTDNAVTNLQAIDPDDPANLPVFRQALSDKVPIVKEAAIRALAGHGGPAALDLLRDAFHNSDPAVKLMVIENIVSIPEAFSFLREGSQDADASVREAAQHWLDLRADSVPDPVEK
jgi:HEAT repeat protein